MHCSVIVLYLVVCAKSVRVPVIWDNYEVNPAATSETPGAHLNTGTGVNDKYLHKLISDKQQTNEGHELKIPSKKVQKLKSPKYFAQTYKNSNEEDFQKPRPSIPIIARSLGQGLWHQFLNGKDNINFGANFYVPVQQAKESKWIDHSNSAWSTNLENSLLTDDASPKSTIIPYNNVLYTPNINSAAVPNGSVKNREHIVVEPDLTLTAGSDAGIPTRPIYPGEGFWAKYGSKHKPFLRQDAPIVTLNETNPEGIHVFNNEAENFDKLKEDFENDLGQISVQNNADHEPASDIEENEGIEQESNEDDFIPLKTYSQVRKYENEEHLPASVLEPRLREIIKDSKIHTVYTEEGYEDVGYDHAGHEKHAENNEGEEQEYDHTKPSLDSDAEGTTYTDPSSASNFAQTAVSKTASVKENGTGAIDYEIYSKMKVQMKSPNTKPKVSSAKMYKGFPNGGTDSTPILSIKNNDKIDQNTAQSIMADINKHFGSSAVTHSRKRRFTNDFPDVKVDTSFIEQFDFKEKMNIQTTEKYPYYKMTNVPKHSTLRYAQDMDTIPIKEEGKMVIYTQNSDVPCEEFPDDVNPIPKHIEKLEKAGGQTNENSNKSGEFKGPRLRNLGDKIDCFKERYFGENPLDSPIFFEDKVEAPLPIFKELSEKQLPAETKEHGDPLKVPKDDKEQLQIKINSTKDADLEVETSNIPNLVYYSKRPFPLARKSKELHLNTEILRRADDSSVTYSDTLPDNSTEPLPEKLALRFKVIRMRKHPRITMRNDKLNVRYHQSYPLPATEYQTTSISPKHKTISEVFYKDEIKPSEQLNVFADVINNIKNSSLNEEEENGSANLQLSNVKKSRLQYNTGQPRSPIGEDFMQTFFQTSTERPKPSQQTNTNYYFSSTLVPMVTSKYYEVDSTNKRKYPAYKVYENLPEDRSKISKKKLRYSVSSGSKALSLEPNQYRQGNIIKRTPTSALFHNTQYIDDNVESVQRGTHKAKISQPAYTTADLPLNKYLVPGMKPPPIAERRFVYEEYKMKNPQKRFSIYSQHERSRRSASRLSYSEIKRPQSSKIVEEEKMMAADEDDDVEDDEYIPHRPKTYHYDPETDKIVYTKTTTEYPVESLEEVEYDDEEDEPETKTNKPPKTDTLRTIYHKDVLDKANGPTLVDFLAKLRSDPSYEVITDPVPTEKPAATSTTTGKPEKTTPPAFLGFLEKLHKNEEYVKIEDEDETSKKNKKVVASSTVSPIEDDDEEKEEENEDEEDDTLPQNIQNSPGGQFSNGGGLQLFDISEYLPKSKNFSPRTTIDYSKYKTIDRGSAPKQPLEDENTAQESQEIRNRRRPLQEATSITPRTSSVETTTIVENKVSTQRISFRNNMSAQNRRRRITTPKPVYTENNGEDSSYPEEKNAIEISTTPEATITTKQTPTTSTTSTTTTKKPSTSIRIRTRKRPTTFKPSILTTSENSRKSTESSSSLQTDPTASTTHHPIPRVYPRRPKPALKIRLRTTTPSEKDSIEEIDEDPHSRPQRKLDDHYVKVPPNHKAFYTPIIVEDRMDYLDSDYIEMQKQPRLVTEDIIHYNMTSSVASNSDQIKAKQLDVEIFKEYDKEKRHGGNYVKENDKENNMGVNVGLRSIINRRRQLKRPQNNKKLTNNSDKKGDTKNIDSEENKTRKPVIIKDPSKRLYYYAPI